ncbi:YigZ family protein [Enterococcus ureilyticus]|uniref:YigZ family protein n=1 Tax=Enterococcus ureilyticus TaxID=1131292 RepID=A0A1E5HGF1_9ENTE|nr:YigZ family protein [Enterococcus ureilyticus]MBM7689694.1 putative YigZ family protein [Enterococcus ureilyticus]MBO0445740.1 YigZ family protein [Enterococcus ureilyticus]OEG24034.1 YigZ family protein [Enterococcus ureilyticus]
MLESYFTIRSDGESEIEIKKSRFICSLKRVYSEDEAKIFIAQKKKEHWKATHNCSAFIIGEKSAIQRSSDDGEPSGTAGVPMLEVLKKQELINVVAVVTRYFGGTKLGSGGLIRAYSHAVSHALTEIGLVEGKLQQEIRLTISYPNVSKVQNFMENNLYTIKETVYGEQVTIICLVDEPNTEQFMTEIVEQLNGQVHFDKGKCSYHEQPITKKGASK